MEPGREPLLLLADKNGERRATVRRWFADSGWLVVGAADGLACLDQLASMQPDVLLVALDIPWGGGEGVIARLKDSLLATQRPLILVFGEGTPRALSVRTGVPADNCFALPLRRQKLLDRIGRELDFGRDQAHVGQRPARRSFRGPFQEVGPPS